MINLSASKLWLIQSAGGEIPINIIKQVWSTLLTKLTKIFLHFLRWSFLTDSSNEYLPRLGLFRLGLGSGRLGINLLSINKVIWKRQNSLQGGCWCECDKSESSTPLKIHNLLVNIRIVFVKEMSEEILKQSDNVDNLHLKVSLSEPHSLCYTDTK